MKKPIPFGKYYLLERINVGGMAEVFRAKAYGVEGFERLLAVKRILPNIAEDQEFITMFIDEAKIAVQLNHANIAQIFDLGVVDGSYFIAMEHIHGRDLRAIFERCRQRNEPMPVAQACFCAMKMCEGLDYAHNKRDAQGREMHLVHRDVSPQNILVSFEGEVKLIDFGIAKAAGKVGKTQAGILKGKFSYMSPEQVRGLPIDRRSDIFSTGIVLYELLTNERLFVGESDFSTLEKVRNVEILPPSTYNRKIPEELERIVLKALSKDPEDRYQNAIDLHDELQAFVYTAGEFYSRKDLASWMKKGFTKEIEDETAKLEQYRQMAPPEVRPPAVSRPTPAPAPGRRPTMTIGAVGAPPPPPAPTLGGNGRAAGGTRPPPLAPTPPSPAAAQGQGATSGPGAALGSGGGGLVVQAASAAAPGAGVNSAGVNGSGVKKAKPAGHKAEDQTNELEWDDEELETQIYDTPDGKPPALIADLGAMAQAQAREPSAPGQAAGGAMSASPPSPSAALPRPAGPPKRNTSMGLAVAAAGIEAAAPAEVALPPPPDPAHGMGAPPSLGAKGSGPGPSPFLASAQTMSPNEAFGPPPVSDEPSAISAIASQPFRSATVEEAPVVVAQSPALVRRSKTPLLLIGAAAIMLLGGVGTYVALSGKKSGESATAAAPGAASPAPARPTPAMADPATGFKLWSDPEGAHVKLDGNDLPHPTPIQTSNLSPGKHTLEITLLGHKPKFQEIDIPAGQQLRVDVKLDPTEVAARFASEPPGAQVTVVVDGASSPLGLTPAQAKLDPLKKAQVVFKKDGYEPVTRDVDPAKDLAAAGGNELSIVVVLERAKVAQVTPPSGAGAGAGGGPGSDRPRPPRNPPADSGAPRDPVPPRDPPKDPVDVGAPKDPAPKDPPREPAVAGTGTLLIGAKPQCKIYIDGKDTGLSTPQRDLQVKAGTHRITLVNNEYNIKETFSVEVKAGAAEKVVKDYTDQIPE